MSEERVGTRKRLRLLFQFRLLDEAAQRKLIKFAWSGLLIVIFGLVLIVLGIRLNTGAYSTEGLLIGFGAIAVLIGIVRVLIGFINPMTPTDLTGAGVEVERLRPHAH